MKKLVSILVLVSACGAAVDDGSSAGDDTTGGGDGSGDGGGGGPPVESATVKFQTTTVRDERADTIDFSSGEPVHTHGTTSVALGGTGCPDVYKFGYLMDPTPPKFGKQTLPNPLAWKVEIKNTGSLDLAMAAYRVRGADASLALDWTKLPSLANSIATLTLTRTAGMPSTDGPMYLDIRTVSRDGEETITTACWTQHTLAAPIEVQQARPEPSGLASMSLVANSPISTLFAGVDVPVFSQRYVHYTTEPVTLAIDLANPTGNFRKRVVDDYVVSSTGASGLLCHSDADNFDSTDPECTQTPPLDPGDLVRSDVLASGAWTLTVIDEATGAAAAACTVSNLHATCQLPARGITEAAHAYRAVLSVRDVNDLAPSTAGPYAEITIGGLTFTGRTLDTQRRCAQFQEITKFGSTIITCKTYVEYTRIHALDQAKLAFDVVPFPITTGGAPLSYVPAATQAVPPMTWDSGDDDLPGPQ